MDRVATIKSIKSKGEIRTLDFWSGSHCLDHYARSLLGRNDKNKGKHIVKRMGQTIGRAGQASMRLHASRFAEMPVIGG